MDAGTAARVLVLRAFETAARDGPLWSAQDRDWATRVARDAPAGAPGTADAADPAVPSDGGAAFIAARAQAAWQRLGPREPVLASWLAARPPRLGLWCVLLGLAAGVLADAIGSSQRINLLNPPAWGVVAWNLAVLAVLAVAALRPAREGSAGSEGGEGGVAQRLGTWFAARRPGARGRGGSATARQEFALSWARASAPLQGARMAAALHAGAAALALGLIAGLYLRGLVLDYRVEWQSTFLHAGTVQQVLAWLFAPAAWLSGIAVPEVSALQAAQATSGSAGAAGSAAPWIHLYAITLGLAVVLPRGLLALAAQWRARRLARALPLDLSEPYFHALRLAASHGALRVQILPHGQALPAQAALALRTALARSFGEAVQLQVQPACEFGHEEAFDAAFVPAADLHIAWVDMTTTPEAEQHGQWLARLRAAHVPAPLLWVDAAAFMQRFGHLPERVTQRRAAWAQFAQARGLACVFGDADAPAQLARAFNR